MTRLNMLRHIVTCGVCNTKYVPEEGEICMCDSPEEDIVETLHTPYEPQRKRHKTDETEWE